jgi:cytochrome c oxidase subunit 4
MAHAADTGHDHHKSGHSHGHGDHGHGHGAGHGHGGGHGHTIIPMRMLVLVLTLLLTFTVLTVGAASLELFIAKMFDITLPTWVNVAVALSIAAVKSLIVAAYFMQLRYDNPLNTMIAVFTILVLTFFLGFTMIDMGARKALYDYKGVQKIDGGVGGLTIAGGLQVPADTSVAMYARQRADAQIDSLLAEGKPLSKVLAQRLAYRTHEMEVAGKPVPESWTAYLAKHPEVMAKLAKAHSKDDHEAKHEAKNSADTARVRTGITLPELLPAGEKPAGEHGDGGQGGK